MILRCRPTRWARRIRLVGACAVIALAPIAVRTVVAEPQDEAEISERATVEHREDRESSRPASPEAKDDEGRDPSQEAAAGDATKERRRPDPPVLPSFTPSTRQVVTIEEPDGFQNPEKFLAALQSLFDEHETPAPRIVVTRNRLTLDGTPEQIEAAKPILDSISLSRFVRKETVRPKKSLHKAASLRSRDSDDADLPDDTREVDYRNPNDVRNDIMNKFARLGLEAPRIAVSVHSRGVSVVADGTSVQLALVREFVADIERRLEDKPAGAKERQVMTFAWKHRPEPSETPVPIDEEKSETRVESEKERDREPVADPFADDVAPPTIPGPPAAKKRDAPAAERVPARAPVARAAVRVQGAERGDAFLIDPLALAAQPGADRADAFLINPLALAAQLEDAYQAHHAAVLEVEALERQFVGAKPNRVAAVQARPIHKRDSANRRLSLLKTLGRQAVDSARNELSEFDAEIEKFQERIRLGVSDESGGGGRSLASLRREKLRLENYVQMLDAVLDSVPEID